ncbi:MAG: hypothetical protein EAZ78_05155 [Oscillatoriales cyanobacterium]|uniref:hypothetical protein n=1 Tax=Microcoleus anatoxicus TaxID=2705319 RepID=UPI0029732775|nr:MAG: hypothetical protein EA000_07335 [Oscillatoriales cyanobacterium]TAF05606.1 MAG: hypothetical protein EAZ78_05155 [Oscillatoriales cyanobacterium]TAF59995.1 MAG: hypothetical protein EAZ59_26920 [Oscillatoriales cyanobacterium]
MLLNLLKVVDLANSWANFYKSLLLVALVLPFAAIPGQASPNYQERDGIYGEIKFAEFCNTPNNLRARVIAEAGSRDSRVESVEFKMYSRYSLNVNFRGIGWAVPSGENWRTISPVGNQKYNTRNGDRRFYDTGVLVGLFTSIVDSPIKFSIHVNHSRGKTIDLGGVIDLGKIEVGQCRIYDDGNFR